MLVDTDVLVWFLRGRAAARRTILEHSPVEMSAVTYMELAQGVRNRQELQLLQRTIRRNGWRIVPLSEDISHRATIYVERYALSDGMRLADALIAASAVQSGSTLLTGNARHYRCIPDLALERYDPAGPGP